MSVGLLGREGELRELNALLLEGQRVLTLLGPGGVGKTRLARALSAELSATTFCELHAQGGAAEVAGAVARSLGMVLRSSEPVDELGGLLRTKGSCLLVLDNLEQLDDLATTALESWLVQAPGLRLILTSQRRLGLREERVVPVGPLSVQAGCALFIERARATGVRLKIREVQPLVEALDCLPLSLELAAARCRVMPPHRILGRLSERFKLLSGGRNGPARHASLQAALAWTWDLLSTLQRQVLAQLAIFESSFELGDAERILSLPEGCYAPDILAELVDFSLVQAAPQMRLFGSVRDFALASLTEPELARGRHAAWVASWARPDYPEQRLNARHPQSVELMADAEAALAWCLERGDLNAGGCALVIGAIREQAGPQQGTGEALRRCLDLKGLEPEIELRLWLWFGRSHRYGARLDEFGQALDRAQTVAEKLGPVALASVAYNRATLLWYSGDLEGAQSCCEQGLAPLSAEPELSTLRARLLGTLATVCNLLGQVTRSRSCYQEALREASDTSERAVLSGNLGLMELDDGQLGPAEVYLERSIQGARELEFRSLESVMLGNLALCRSLQGRDEDACALLLQAAEMSAAIGDLRSLRYQRASLAEIQLHLGELSAAGEHIVFLMQDLERESTIAALVKGLHLEWLARTGSKEAAQQAVHRVLSDAATVGLPQLEGMIYAQLARLFRDGLVQGDSAEMLAKAQVIAVKLQVRPSSGLAQAIARAQPSPAAGKDLSFVAGESGQVDLRRRPLLRRLLAPLADGAAVPTMDLLEAGWPDSKLPPDRLAPRLYSALHELRRLGVRVENEEGEYRLCTPQQGH
ncbi:MAG: putative ATPase [Cognaticolwellia sp.]